MAAAALHPAMCRLRLSVALGRIGVMHVHNACPQDKLRTNAVMAAPPARKVREYEYRTKDGPPLKIILREGSLSDGVGVRLWVTAHTLCRCMIT